MKRNLNQRVKAKNTEIKSLGRPRAPKKLGVSVRYPVDKNKKIISEKLKLFDPSHVLKQVRALRMYWRKPEYREKAEELIEFAEQLALEEMINST